MVLYIAGRCAITQDHSGRNHTVGLRVEARHVLALCLSSYFYLSLLDLCLWFASPTRCIFPLQKSQESNQGDCGQTSTIIWMTFLLWFECLTPTYPGSSDITSRTCNTTWKMDYAPQFEKHTVWVFIMHISGCVGCACVWCQGIFSCPWAAPLGLKLSFKVTTQTFARTLPSSPTNFFHSRRSCPPWLQCVCHLVGAFCFLSFFSFSK